MGGEESPVAHTPMTQAAEPAADTTAPRDESGMHAGMMDPAGGHSSINLVDAQAIKDATMAHFIMRYWAPGKLFLHFNGAYHSDDFESMVWFLKQANEELKIITISTVSQDDIEELDKESLGKAHFIITVPSQMTQTNR
jgi:hypothetical protein